MRRSIDIVTDIQMIDKCLGLVIPTLGVADKGKPETRLPGQSLLDAGYIASVDIGFARYTGIVGATLQKVTRKCCPQQDEADRSPAQTIQKSA